MPAYSIMHHLKVLSSENPTLNPPHFHVCVPNTQRLAPDKQLLFQNKTGFSLGL